MDVYYSFKNTEGKVGLRGGENKGAITNKVMKVEISGRHASKEVQLFSHKPRELASFWTAPQWFFSFFFNYLFLWLHQVLIVSCKHLAAACGI